MNKFEFESNGGCALCDAMDIEHDEIPTRPHPNCDCKITSSKNAKCFEFTIEMDGDADVKENGNEFEVDFFLDYHIHVNCESSSKADYKHIHKEDILTIEKQYFTTKLALLSELAYNYLDEAMQAGRDMGLKLCNC